MPGCGLLPERVLESPTGAAAPLETAAARLTEVSIDEAAFACAPNARPQTARVTRVIDGDTIEVRLEGQTVRVRYIGIDTPETDERFYEQATLANATLVDGKTVTLFRDVSETDRYGRLLRYVFVGDVFVNYELIRQGYAFASTYPPDVACAVPFSEAEHLARTERIGLWAGAEDAQDCHPSYPTVCIPPPRLIWTAKTCRTETLW